MFSVGFDHFEYFWIAIFLVGLWKDWFEYALVSVISGLAIGVALFEMWDLQVFVSDGACANLVAHDLFLK